MSSIAQNVVGVLDHLEVGVEGCLLIYGPTGPCSLSPKPVSSMHRLPHTLFTALGTAWLSFFNPIISASNKHHIPSAHMQHVNIFTSRQSLPSIAMLHSTFLEPAKSHSSALHYVALSLTMSRVLRELRMIFSLAAAPNFTKIFFISTCGRALLMALRPFAV